jgi:integrase
VKINLPYLSAELDRHGKPRLYVRRYGRRVRIREVKNSPGFAAAYAQAVRELSGWRAGRTAAPNQTHPRGSLGWLGAQYFASAEFKRLAARSQATRRLVLEECFRESHRAGDPEPIGNCPLPYVTAAKVKRLRDLKAGKPGAANNRRKYLSALFGWAVEAGHMTSNPARDVRRVRYASEGFHTWTADEVRQFVERHPIGSKARLALALLLFTGARRGDVVTFGKQHVRGGWLRFVPSKTSYRRKTLSEKPLLPILAEIIAQSPCGDLTFLVTEYGQPFTPAGFGNWFRDRCDEAGLPHCTAHGLRKAGATIAAENGATVHQLMAIFDWTTISQAQKYI